VEALPRYSETGPRWGGMAPLRQSDGVLIHHRELNGSDDSDPSGPSTGTITYEPAGEAPTPRGSDGIDVLMGQDADEISELSYLNSENRGYLDQEMLEKKGMPSLLPSAMEGLSRQLSYPESMDVDDLARETHASAHKIDLTENRAELE
jgi:hypothetical protein